MLHRGHGRAYRRIGLTALTLLLSTGAHCRLVAPPSIQKLTADSNFVAVVEVADVRQVGTVTFTDSQHNPLEGKRMSALLRLEETLKGEVSGNSIEVEYDFNRDWPMNGGPITSGFTPGSMMIVFLQCVAQKCSVTDPQTAGFPVAKKTVPVPEPPETSAYYLVLQRIAAGLFGDRSTQSGNERSANLVPRELFVLDTEHVPYISTLFHAALDQLDNKKKDDSDFRGELIAALVRRGETTMLPQLEEALFASDSGVHSQAQGNMILALHQIDWHESLPIAARALQLPSVELRRFAAHAIQNLRMQPYRPPPNEMSVPATHALLSALHDPDPGVAFYVMQSLGFVNARLDQRPKSTTHDAQWDACLHFWENFPDSMSGQ
jgi:hypothetical protein